MNTSISYLLSLGSGLGFCWCAKEFFLPRKTDGATNEKETIRVVAVQDVCHRWRPVDKSAPVNNPGFVIVANPAAEPQAPFPRETPAMPAVRGQDYSCDGRGSCRFFGGGTATGFGRELSRRGIDTRCNRRETGLWQIPEPRNTEVLGLKLLQTSRAVPGDYTGYFVRV